LIPELLKAVSSSLNPVWGYFADIGKG